MSLQRSLFCAFVCQCLFVGMGCSVSTDSSTIPAPDESATAETQSETPETTVEQTTSPDPDAPAADETEAGPEGEMLEVAAIEPSEVPVPTVDGVPTTDDSSSLEDLSRQDLVKTVSNGVVLVTVFDARGEELGFGSGSVVGDDLVLTNHHVIATAVSATVQLKSDDEEAPKLPVTGFVQVDEVNDLALLRVDELPDDLFQFEIAEPESVEQFEEVFAIGHPDGLQFSVTRGFVNATQRVSELPELIQYSMSSGETLLIQTDAVIAGGSSGGPLLNLRGELIGINTLHVEETQFAFSVEATHVRELMEIAESAEVSSFPVPGADVLVTEEVASLEFDFYREWMQLTQDLQAAASREEMEEIARNNNPGPACSEQCLDLVRAGGGGMEAVDALKLGADIVRTSGERLGHASRYYLDEAFVVATAAPDLTQADRRVVISLMGLNYSTALEGYLQAVIRDTDDEQTRAAAVLALALAYAAETETEYSADRDELIAWLESDFSSVLVAGSRVEEYVEAYLSQSGAIGSMAQEIVGTDHEGVEFRLSDYAGKVVVLDFWADWCPHCRVMYEHEREMVERLKDEPFALLGVNCDEPARARRVIESGEVTWRSWMDGRGGPITEQWNITAYPTVYVLDQEGRIRFEGVRGDDLEAAVESLLHVSELQFADNIIAGDADWKYTPLSTAEDLSDWRSSEFDDTHWSTGSGMIGYGRSDLDTTIEVGGPGARPMTLLFRHQFELPRDDVPDRQFLKLRYNDGIAVYLNGVELYRSNLSSEAGLGAASALRARNRESDSGICIPVSAELLSSSGNVLAVELHQISTYSADALFSLTFGANLPELSPESSGNDTNGFEVCRLIGQVADGSSEFGDALRAYAEAEATKVRIAAVTAAALLDERVKRNGLDEEEAQLYLYQTVYYLNEDAWRVAETPNLSLQQYESAIRMAEAGLSLKSELSAEAQEVMQGLTNTLGVALYRAGDFENAILKLQESREEVGDNPVNIAYLSLAHHGLGQMEEADQHRQEFVELMNTPEWEHYRTGLEAAKELDEAFGEE